MKMCVTSVCLPLIVGIQQQYNVTRKWDSAKTIKNDDEMREISKHGGAGDRFKVGNHV